MTIDKSNMRQIILDFSKQFEKGLEAAKDINPIGKFTNVVVCGMGGSALPADILKAWLETYKFQNNKKLTFCVHRSYGLPLCVDTNSLVVCISYSGNTEETISAYEEAIKQKITVISMATGGKLADLAQKHKTPFVKIPDKPKIPPRNALGYQFAALAKIFANCGFLKNKKEQILEMAKLLQPETLEQEGKRIAQKLVGKIPLIYTSDRFRYIARLWKIKFNENSKSPAFWNYFPELNHNEMEGMAHENKSQFRKEPFFYSLILEDENDHPRIKQRMKVTAQILAEKGIPTEIIKLPQTSNQLSKIFSAVILGDWISYYLALTYQVDPTPVKTVEEFKKRLE